MNDKRLRNIMDYILLNVIQYYYNVPERARSERLERHTFCSLFTHGYRPKHYTRSVVKSITVSKFQNDKLLVHVQNKYILYKCVCVCA